MAEFYQEQINHNSSRNDRYRNCNILKDNETGETLLATREIAEIRQTSSDKYHRVEENEVNRLDKLSQKYYNTPLLWWVIAQANNIYDPLAEIAIGTVLRIPSTEALYGNGGALL